ncbi:DUF4232 domain-containing protein [Streptomyces sp. NRRL F-5727]|uniref:DUF4232 domain-containing protein n=1 Tax=Streptomyces sp. NRRL F-5727 TaxID=1463871 RepID=UPI0004CB5C81|nr:DUF4232 domain-containing protein [Streptomyces sp. NRRL F-5727]
MRTSHRTIRTALLVAAVAAASLSLTACGGDDAGAKDAGSARSSQSAAAPETTAAAPAASASASATAAGQDGASAAPAAAKTTTGSGGTSGGTSGGDGSETTKGAGSGAEAPACAHGDVKITAAKADEVPTEHIVLTATNTSGRACTLLGHPLIAFGDIQTAKDVPPVAKSRPAAPVVLDPGAPAYANVRISLGGVHEDNKVVKEFNVNLFAADGPAEGSVVVTAPAGGVAVDEAVAKTGYWTPELRNGADDF